MWGSWPPPCHSLGVFNGGSVPRGVGERGGGRAGKEERASSENRNGEGERSERRAGGRERSRGMLRGDGERRVYQEQGGGEEERGAVLRAPQVPRDRPAVAGRMEQRCRRLQKHQRVGSSWCCLGGLRGCQVHERECARVCVQAPGVLRPHTASSILTAGQPGPGSPTGCSSQALPAGCQAVSRATICRALWALPQGSWSQRFSQNACDAVLLQRLPGWCQRGRKDAVVSPSSCGAHPAQQHPSLRAHLPVPRGSSVCVGASGEGDGPSGARSVLLQARAVFGRIWALPWFR